MHIFFTLILSFISFSLIAQQTPKKYWVGFKDKANSAFSVEEPESFLSARALERRQKHGIAIIENDLPVNSVYLSRLEEKGAIIHNTSKWLNGTSVIATDSIIALISNLPFIVEIKYVGKHHEGKLALRRSGKKRDTISDYLSLESRYGYAETQISTLRGAYLHEQSFQGEGMMIGVLDGGFSNVDIMPFFDSLRHHNRLLYQRDFVEGDDYVYESSSHGSQVLSVMGANVPGFMVGTAPNATYVCLKSEDTKGEYLIEEINWVAALEYADSLGVDIVNSSLGYTVFHDSKMNYEYEDLNGKTAIASRGADIAFTKGMIVINSAGNEGNSEWKYIDVPADGINVLSVGATNFDGKRARFSSIGPSPDGRIKPEIVAPGKGVTVASTYSMKVNRANGTSFSSPLIAGLVACLWQAFPNKTNREIMDAVIQSSSQYGIPDEELGYGIPNFYEAFQLLSLKP